MRTSYAPDWQYLLWAGLTIFPIALILVVIFLLPVVPSEATKDNILVSRGILGLAENPYLKRREGGVYRLLCPLAPYRDRHRRWCFDERLWRMKGEEIIVSHGQPIKSGVTKVVICDITDAEGATLFRPGQAAKCK